MEITTHNSIELTLAINEHLYSLKMQNGVPIDEALEACRFFMAALLKKKEEGEVKEEETTNTEIKE